VQLLGLLRPPRLRIAGRLLIDGRVFEQGLLAKLRRGLEAFDVEQVRQFEVELLAVAHPGFAGHR
jgi:hypothetical protein